MKLPDNRPRAVGIAAGVAIFVATALFATIAATKSPPENREPITNIGQLQGILGKSPNQVLLLVKRNGANLFAVIRLK